MQNDRTTGCIPMTSDQRSDCLETMLERRAEDLAALAHQPDSEFKLLETWPVMAHLGVRNRESYCMLRQVLRKKLRDQAVRLRALKHLDKSMQRLMPHQSRKPVLFEIAQARKTFNALIALRRMSRAWSKAVRTGALPGGTDTAPGRAATVLEQLAAAVREERRLRAACRDRWNSGRDDPRLEKLHGDAHDRIDTLLKLADELKEN